MTCGELGHKAKVSTVRGPYGDVGKTTPNGAGEQGKAERECVTELEGG